MGRRLNSGLKDIFEIFVVKDCCEWIEFVWTFAFADAVLRN